MPGDPTRHFFKCPHCGHYEVDGGTFNRFLPAHLRKEVSKNAGTLGFVLEFKSACPRCSPQNQSAATLSVLERKVH